MPRKCPCGTQPIFNVPGETVGVCCRKCKTEEMIDVIHKRCSCDKTPKFNVPREKVGVCCFKCKTADMIDVVSKRCSCGNRPIYNVPGEKIGIFCWKCKTDDMVNVMNKRCPCGKQPYFNISGEIRGVCCKNCKTAEMIDVIHKRCPCGKIPLFNVPGETIGVCCRKCKTDEMIDVRNNICPGYNIKCPVRTRIGNGHKYCMTCDPNEARRKQYKRYEDAFFDYIKNKLDVYQREFRVSFEPSETDKKFARLDGIIIDDGIIVCLEVDEDGHQDYECDEHRMHLVTGELLQKYPAHTVSWIRVNPTTNEKTQWSKTSKKIREQRFEEVVSTVNDTLKKRDTRVVYIGF